MGCALSHIRVWEAIATSSAGPNEVYLVLEDDVILQVRAHHAQGATSTQN